MLHGLAACLRVPAPHAEKLLSGNRLARLEREAEIAEKARAVRVVEARHAPRRRDFKRLAHVNTLEQACDVHRDGVGVGVEGFKADGADVRLATRFGGADNRSGRHAVG